MNENLQQQKSSEVHVVENAKMMHGTHAGGKLLGRLLVEQGKIVEEDIDRIVKHGRKKRLRFGEAAISLRLISPRDLEHAMAIQFDYPFLEKTESQYSRELIAAFKPFSRKGQALRNLCSRLLLRWYSEAQKSLAVVGTNNREGCSYVAANIAVVFSQLGYKTLLIDGNLQAARQHELFQLKNKSGLSAVLIGRTSSDLVIRQIPGFRALSVMPAGAQPPNPVELVGRRELPVMMSELQQKYDMIIADTPPMNLRIGSEIIARACGSAIVVARKNRTPVSDAKGLINALHSAGANVVGTALADF